MIWAVEPDDVVRLAVTPKQEHRAATRCLRQEADKVEAGKRWWYGQRLREIGGGGHAVMGHAVPGEGWLAFGPALEVCALEIPC